MSEPPPKPPTSKRQRGLYAEYGQQLKALRQQHKLSFEQLAQRTQFSAAFLKKLEAGDSVPSLESRERLGAVLGQAEVAAIEWPPPYSPLRYNKGWQGPASYPAASASPTGSPRTSEDTASAQRETEAEEASRTPSNAVEATLKNLRLNRPAPVSQRQVAQSLGITVQSYLAIEKGRSKPSPRVKAKLVELFGAKIKELFG